MLGGYRIERALGSGGMGTVYLAAHPALPRHDALKVLWPHLAADPEFRARFEREANLAATLDHPNIVTVHNRGEDQGFLWIALQYVPGTDAATSQAHEPRAMTAARAVHIVTEIGKALDHAHHRGMLHRDIKPANFLLAPQPDGSERVLLADFGIAKPTDGGTELTRTGAFMATVAYASPEQLTGGTLDPRSDVYSLACSFFRLLTGQNPYPGTEALNVMLAHLNDPPPRVTASCPDLPAAIDEVLARALAKVPAHRYGTCREFVDAATEVLSGSAARTAPTMRNVSAAPPSVVSKPPVLTPMDRPSFTTRDVPGSDRVAKRLGMIIGIVLVVVIVAMLGWAFRSEDDGTGSAAETIPTTIHGIGTTSPVPKGLPDPCGLLQAGVTDRYFLAPQGSPSYTADQRRCQWAPAQSANVGADISVVAQRIPSDPARQQVRVANKGDAQEVRTAADADKNYSTCAVSWSTSYGYIKVALNNYNETLDIDQLCKRTLDLAASVSGS
ncbi:serine/threonine protein kinase [Nocardia sp. NPDC004582]